MDNVTHSLTGLALSRAGLNRFCPRATLLLLLSANLPDIDIVTLAKGQFAYLEAHRGITHTFLAMPVLAIECVLVVAIIYRQKLPWLRAWLICCLGLCSHLLLDWTNSYGIRPFVPFSGKWFYLDINSLTDWPILAVLLIAAVWPVFSRLVGSEIGDKKQYVGRGMASAALLFFLFFDTGRAVLHRRAVAQLESRLYDNFPPVNAAALPDKISPFRWNGIVETESVYRVLEVYTLGQLNPESAKIFFKPVPSVYVENARRIQPFAFFLYFSRFPVWSVQPVSLKDSEGKRIDVSDLRFGSPGEGDFHCIAVETKTGQIIRSWFTFGPGADLGWGYDVEESRPR